MFRAWQECSRGRPCDYTGITYERLRGGSGIPWPCNDEHPDGTVRLYADGVFPTDPDFCEDYGHDLVTGATVEPTAYRATAPGGRAFLKAVPYLPAHEEPDDEYPFRYGTGCLPGSCIGGSPGPPVVTRFETTISAMTGPLLPRVCHASRRPPRR